MGFFNSITELFSTISKGTGITKEQQTSAQHTSTTSTGNNIKLNKVVVKKPTNNNTRLQMNSNANINNITKKMEGIHVIPTGPKHPNHTVIPVSNSLTEVVTQQGGKRKTRRRVHKKRTHKRKTHARSYKKRMH
jgi:hypothetical protein